jgi:hypothetical protein
MNSLIVRVALVTIFGMSAIALESRLLAQDAEQASRESVIERIRAHAAREVDTNTPMDRELVLRMFSGGSPGLGDAEIIEEYEQEYAARKASRFSPVEALLKAGWFVAIVLVGVYILRRVQQKSRLRRLIAQAEATPSPTRAIERPAPPAQDGVRMPIVINVSPTAPRVEPAAAEPNRAGSTLSRQLAGIRVLRGYALVCYRAGVLNDFKECTVQFDPARRLQVTSLYVTPRIRDGNTEIDPFTAVVRYPRLLLKAPSGGGKSVLLRRLALASFQEGIPNLRGRPIPLLLELRRLTPVKLLERADAGAKRSLLEQELVDEFDRRGFPNADLFLGRSLDQGRILLLFDGLDEVKGGARTEVARLIKDLFKKYPNARAVVTCRSNAYKNEFAQAVEASLDIEEFSDQQILEFLAQWKRTLPAEHAFSVEQFLKVTHNREPLIPLIRNPLLLAMLAFLHTERPQCSSDSRTQILEHCTDHLLGRSASGQGSAAKESKGQTLARLALAMQENAEVREGDGLSVDQPTAISEARKVLADPTHNSTVGVDADGMLRELVDRDCLLAGYNGGYGFRHRAFQDYFAARALKDDGAGLVQRFRRSSATWLKTVKLWCGMDHDSTDVLTAIFAEDPLTALICLGETKHVNTELSGRILAAFKDRLGNSQEDAILSRAFASALHQEHCGEEIFRTLVQALSAGERPVRRSIAARTLALSNTSRAAAELARFFSDGPEFRQALQEMGDLAVGELAELATNGNVQAFDSLRVIGTPAAAFALVPFLWKSDCDLATCAAWRLAALLQRPPVEAALERYESPAPRPAPGPLDWIWEPFTKSDRSPLPLLAGQIASLLERAAPETIPTTPLELDPRIVLPLCGIIKKQDAWRVTEEMPAKMRATVNQAIRKSTGKRLAALNPGKLGPVDAETADARSRFVSLVLHVTQPAKTWQYLFESLQPDVQFNFLFGLFQGPSPRRIDWLEVAKTPTWRNMRSRNPLRAFQVEDRSAPQPAPANNKPAEARVGSS